MTASLLTVTDLDVRYPRVGRAPAVDGISFAVGRGEAVALVGESGSGKSTTAHAVLGLLPRDAQVTGAIDFDGTELTGLGARGWRRLRGARIGFVPQDPTVSLNPTRRVGRQIAEAIRIHDRALSDRAVRARVQELLELVGIADPARRALLFPHEMSGGMRQRVLIAGALAHEPELIVADEPTSALDVTVQKQILDHIDGLRAELGIAVLLITHDLGVAAERTERMVVLSQGRVVESGATQDLLARPADDYTARLLASVPALEGGRLRWSEPLQEAVPGAAADAAGPVVLSGEQLHRAFRAPGGGTTVAVDGVDVALRRGQTLGIVGESGSGKSTLARLLTRLTPVDAGTVHFDGADVTHEKGTALRRLRSRLQFVYQNPRASIDPRFTVRRTLAEPLRAAGIRDRNAIQERVRELLGLVGLPAEFADRLPGEVSGGQLQRIAIARALANRPEAIVLDEPVSALDVSVQAQILALLIRLQDQLGLSLVFISHDLAVIRQISDTVVVMSSGRIVEAGSADRLFAAPRSPYTRALLDAVPRVPEAGPALPRTEREVVHV